MRRNALFTQRARELRRNENGFKFRRQHALGRYIADFICVKARLAADACEAKAIGEATASTTATGPMKSATTRRLPNSETLDTGQYLPFRDAANGRERRPAQSCRYRENYGSLRRSPAPGFRSFGRRHPDLQQEQPAG
jgi:hypothetical protein